MTDNDGTVGSLVVDVEHEGMSSLEPNQQLLPAEMDACDNELVVVTAGVPESDLKDSEQSDRGRWEGKRTP